MRSVCTSEVPQYLSPTGKIRLVLVISADLRCTCASRWWYVFEINTIASRHLQLYLWGKRTDYLLNNRATLNYMKDVASFFSFWGGCVERGVRSVMKDVGLERIKISCSDIDIG